MDKILFFDIDGTLGQHGVITESNLKALHLLKEKGYNLIDNINSVVKKGDIKIYNKTLRFRFNKYNVKEGIN